MRSIFGRARVTGFLLACEQEQDVPRIQRDRSSKHERKDAQFRSEVEEIIALALLESADERLRQLSVCSVDTRAGGACVAVSVVPTGRPSVAEIEQVQAALDGARGWLRQQIAEEVNRQRVPDLILIVVPPWEADP